MAERFFVYRAQRDEGLHPPQYRNDEFTAFQKESYSYLQSQIGISNPEVDQELESIRSFNDKLSLRTPPFLLFEATEKTLDVIRTRVIDSRLENPNVGALYTAALDIAFIAVNRSIDPARSTATLMHEATHGNGGVHINGVWDGPNEKYVRKRTGFGVHRHNSHAQVSGELHDYTDEGRSELLAGIYSSIVHGYRGHTGMSHFGFELPPKYVHRTGKNGVILAPGTLAAPGLELLIHKNEAVLDGLLYGAGDFNSLRRLYHTLNAIRPGLRRDISNVPYGIQASADMTTRLINELYDGDKSAVFEASEHTQELIQQKLDAPTVEPGA